MIWVLTLLGNCNLDVRGRFLPAPRDLPMPDSLAQATKPSRFRWFWLTEPSAPQGWRHLMVPMLFLGQVRLQPALPLAWGRSATRFKTPSWRTAMPAPWVR